MDRRHATKALAAALAASALVVAGCGAGDATFSASGFDAIEVGDTAESVTAAIGELASTQELVPGDDGGGGAVWIYCDGPRPHYLVITDDAVTEDDLQLPDELRIDAANCS